MSAPCNKPSNGMMCLCGLIGIFRKYASKDKDTTHLNKSELKELLEKEFPVLLSGSADPEEVNKIMAALDCDGDGQVDIQEYFVTLCTLGVLLNEAAEAHCNPKKC